MAQNDLYFRIRVKDDSKAGIASVVTGLKSIGIQARLVKEKTEGMNDGFRKTRAQTATLGAQFRSVAKSLRFLGGVVGVVGVVGIGRQLGKAVSDTTKTFAAFEHQLAEVRGLIDGTGSTAVSTAAKMKLLSQSAQQLGITTVFSAKQVAQAMGEMARAGLTTSEILESIEPALQLAAAGGLEMAEAAQIATRTVRGLQLETDDLAGVMDLMALTASRSVQTISDIGQAMGFAASAAKIAGVSMVEMDDAAENATIDFLDLSSALAVAANAGIKGTIAGTALRKGLTQLLSLAESGKGKIGAIADEITVFAEDGSRKLKPLAEVMRVFESRGVTALDMFQLLGVRAGNTFAVLRNLGSEGIKKVNDLLRDFEGFAGRLAEARLDSLTGDTIKLRSALQGLAISIGERVGPQLRGLVQSLTSLVRATTRARSEASDLEQVFRFFSIGLQTAVDAFARITAHVELFRKQIDLLIQQLKIGLAGELIKAAEDADYMQQQLGEIIVAIGGIVAAAGQLDLGKALLVFGIGQSQRTGAAAALEQERERLEAELGKLAGEYGTAYGAATKLKFELAAIRLEMIRNVGSGGVLGESLSGVRDRLAETEEEAAEFEKRLVSIVGHSEDFNVDRFTDALQFLSQASRQKGFADIYGGANGLSAFEEGIQRAGDALELFGEPFDRTGHILILLRDQIKTLAREYENSFSMMGSVSVELSDKLATLVSQYEKASTAFAQNSPAQFLRLSGQPGLVELSKSQQQLRSDAIDTANAFKALGLSAASLKDDGAEVPLEFFVEGERLKDKLKEVFRRLTPDIQREVQQSVGELGFDLSGSTAAQLQSAADVAHERLRIERQVLEAQSQARLAAVRGSELETLRIQRETIDKTLALRLDAIDAAARAEAIGRDPAAAERIRQQADAEADAIKKITAAEQELLDVRAEQFRSNRAFDLIKRTKEAELQLTQATFDERLRQTERYSDEFFRIERQRVHAEANLQLQLIEIERQKQILAAAGNEEMIALINQQSNLASQAVEDLRRLDLGAAGSDRKRARGERKDVAAFGEADALDRSVELLDNALGIKLAMVEGNDVAQLRLITAFHEQAGLLELQAIEQRIQAIQDSEVIGAEERGMLLLEQHALLEDAKSRITEQGIRDRNAAEKAGVQQFTTIVGLMGNALATLFENNKLAAIAGAIVNTAEGVTRALKAADPPLNFIMAGIVAAAGAKQVSLIRSTKMARGGIIPGLDSGFDSQMFLGRPGEAVLPRKLTDMLMATAQRQDDPGSTARA
jgi:TP901 family phage tail tape measure protein